MQKDKIDPNLSSVAFDFFYWFSRFEFALKSNGFLKSHKAGDDAEPDWNGFVKMHQASYFPSTEAKALLASPPKRQIVKSNGDLDWKDVGLSHCSSELEKVVLLVKRVRNNLFHGGKHGGMEWDDSKRTRDLLTTGIAVLGQLASLGSIEDDYLRRY